MLAIADPPYAREGLASDVTAPRLSVHKTLISIISIIIIQRDIRRQL
jgi:hypothetical protein